MMNKSFFAKIKGMIYFGGFLFVYLVIYILLLKWYLLWDKPSFWKFLYCNFWAWLPNKFSFLFLKLLSNFWLSLLRYLKRNCFKILTKISMSNERSWVVILERVLVSIKCSRHTLEVVGKVWHYLYS